jgi:OOP family OmpA-OmpF porin
VPHQLAYAAPEVLFDPGSATLSRGAEARLRDLAQRLRGRGDVEVLLRGHSDELERDGFELSEARARAVRAFLTEQGLSVRRIAWVGFGDAQPIASNETAVGRQRNRRVEIVLREPDVDPYS